MEIGRSGQSGAPVTSLVVVVLPDATGFVMKQSMADQTAPDLPRSLRTATQMNAPVRIILKTSIFLLRKTNFVWLIPGILSLCIRQLIYKL